MKIDLNRVYELTFLLPDCRHRLSLSRNTQNVELSIWDSIKNPQGDETQRERVFLDPFGPSFKSQALSFISRAQTKYHDPKMYRPVSTEDEQLRQDVEARLVEEGAMRPTQSTAAANDLSRIMVRNAASVNDTQTTINANRGLANKRPLTLAEIDSTRRATAAGEFYYTADNRITPVELWPELAPVEPSFDLATQILAAPDSGQTLGLRASVIEEQGKKSATEKEIVDLLDEGPTEPLSKKDMEDIAAQEWASLLATEPDRFIAMTPQEVNQFRDRAGLGVLPESAIIDIQVVLGRNRQQQLEEAELKAGQTGMGSMPMSAQSIAQYRANPPSKPTVVNQRDPSHSGVGLGEEPDDYILDRLGKLMADPEPADPPLKSSGEWLDSGHYKGITILDHDGWDRAHFDASWDEPVTRAEFDHRLSMSTYRRNMPTGNQVTITPISKGRSWRSDHDERGWKPN